MIKNKIEFKREIELSGPEGNAFYLLGIARQYAKQLNKDWKTIQQRMTAGDYENLITVFDEEFGDYVDLIR